MRYGLLETIREFGLDQLTETDESEPVRQEHADYFLALTESAEPLLRGPDQIAWFARLETEFPNIRAALTWLRATEQVAAGLRLAAALWTFWVVRDHLQEGRRWLTSFLAIAPDAMPERINVLIALGDLGERQGDYAAAAAATEDALAFARSRGDPGAASSALRVFGNIAMARGEIALHDHDNADLAAAEFGLARRSLEESLALAQELGDEWGTAKATHWLAIAVGFHTNPSLTMQLFEDSIDAFRRLGDFRQLCLVLWNFASSISTTHDYQRAYAAFAESLELAHKLGYRWHSGLCLIGLADVAWNRGELDRAAWLLGAAEALRKLTGAPLRPIVKMNLDGTVSAVRTAMGAPAFAAAWNAGAQASPAEAITRALKEPLPPAATSVLPVEPAIVDGLTLREREVLRLLTGGHSDRSIADTLFISRRTASKHVAAILAKLSATSRAAAARAVRDGLDTIRKVPGYPGCCGDGGHQTTRTAATDDFPDSVLV